MKKRISAIVAGLAAFLTIIDFGARIFKWMRAIDMRVILEIGIFFIFVLAGSMYIREKYKEIKGKYNSDLKEIRKSIKAVEKKAALDHQFLLDSKLDKPEKTKAIADHAQRLIEHLKELGADEEEKQ